MRTATPSTRVSSDRSWTVAYLRRVIRRGQPPRTEPSTGTPSPGAPRPGLGRGAASGPVVSPIDPHGGRPNRLAVTWSWNRLCATCSSLPSLTPSRAASASKASKLRLDGLYDPMSCAVRMAVNRTPSRSFDPANESRSTLDKMISLNRSASAASAAGESSNAGQSGTEPPSVAASASLTGAPS